MMIKNTENRFGLIAILLHWIMAILLIGLVALGLYMTGLPISEQKLTYYGWHKEFGILVLMLAIVRLTWLLQNITPTLAGLARWEKTAARAAHYAFYFFMFVNPISGWLISSAAGLPVSFFGLFTLPTLISPSQSQQHLFTTIHVWLAYSLIVVFCLHVAASLKHYFINKDQIMQRMLKP